MKFKGKKIYAKKNPPININQKQPLDLSDTYYQFLKTFNFGLT